jgi:hypothetical protein
MPHIHLVARQKSTVWLWKLNSWNWKKRSVSRWTCKDTSLIRHGTRLGTFPCVESSFCLYQPGTHQAGLFVGIGWISPPPSLSFFIQLPDALSPSCTCFGPATRCSLHHPLLRSWTMNMYFGAVKHVVKHVVQSPHFAWSCRSQRRVCHVCFSSFHFTPGGVSSWQNFHWKWCISCRS